MKFNREFMLCTTAALAAFAVSFTLRAAVPGGIEINLKSGMWCFLAGKQQKPSACPYSEKNGSIAFRFHTDGVKWADLWLQKNSRPLPVREKYTVTAEFRVPAGSPLNTISLRMRDAGNKIFQYPRKVDFSKGGVFRESWTVTDSEWKNSWGGKNHIPDLPFQFLGFSLAWAKGAGQEITTELTGVSVLPDSSSKINSQRTLYHFGGGAIYKKGGNGMLYPAENTLLVSGINGETILGRRNVPEKREETRPEYFLLEAEAAAGQTEVRLVLKDSRNKLTATESVVLAPRKKLHKLAFPRNTDSLIPPFRVDSICLKSPNGAVLLKNLSIVCRESLADALDFDMRTGTSFHLLKKGQEGALKYCFSNRADCSGVFSVKLRWKHYGGREFTEQRTVSLQAGETAEISPAFTPDLAGHWDVDAEISVNAKDAPTCRKSSLAYFQPTGPTPERPNGFLFGMNSKANFRSERMVEFEAMAACGVKIVRLGFFLSGIQPQKGKWNLSHIDRLVADAGTFGMEIQVIPFYLPQWLQPTPDRMWPVTYPNDIGEWMNFYRVLAERYRGRIRFYETCNEPDLVRKERLPLEKYVEMQNAAYKALTETDPGVKLLAGGFAGAELPWGRKNFHQEALKRTKGKFHIHATHQHGSFVRYAAATDGPLAEYRKKAGVGNVPWYPNETGAVSMYGGERFQAENVFKKILFSIARRAIAYNWYSSRDDGADPFNAEHHYGLMTWDYHPKPSYSVYNMLTGTYGNAKFERQLNLGDGIWGFVFRAGGDLRLPLWNEQTNPKIHIFRTDASKAYLRDMMGNDIPLSLQDGIVPVEIGLTPVSLLLPGAGTVKEDGSLIRMEHLPVITPGRTAELRTAVRNPFRSPQEFHISAGTPPAGFRMEKRELSGMIKAGDTQVFTFRIQAPDGKDFPRNTIFLNTSCRIGNIRSNFRIPLNPAKLIPAEKKQPDFILNSSDQLVALTHGDPTQAHRIWRGPQDCSAKIYLSESENMFVIRAEVTDDIHFQDGKSGLWNGDSIQCCFQFPRQSGFWELNAARLNNGTVRTEFSNVPLGFNAGNAAAQVKAKISRNGNTTSYRLEIPLNILAASRMNLKTGFRFNLLVNDNDGEGRDGWLHIAPGIGENKNPENYPYLIME